MAKDSLRWLDNAALYFPDLMLCTSEEMYAKVTKKLHIKSPLPWLDDCAGACVHSLECPDQGLICVVCIRIQDISGIIIATRLAHEAVHVVQFMMEEIGEDKPGSEQEAYAVENCLRVLLEDYARQAGIEL